jgi:hypothetical protein
MDLWIARRSFGTDAILLAMLHCLVQFTGWYGHQGQPDLCGQLALDVVARVEQVAGPLRTHQIGEHMGGRRSDVPRDWIAELGVFGHDYEVTVGRQVQRPGDAVAVYLSDDRSLQAAESFVVGLTLAEAVDVRPSVRS